MGHSCSGQCLSCTPDPVLMMTLWWLSSNVCNSCRLGGFSFDDLVRVHASHVYSIKAKHKEDAWMRKPLHPGTNRSVCPVSNSLCDA